MTASLFSPAASRIHSRLARVWMLLVLAASMFHCDVATGVTIFDRASRTQVRGYLVEMDDRRIVVDEELPGGLTKRRTFELAKVDVYQRVKTDRLESLSSSSPDDYRAYADELSAAKADPDARRTAQRLYLIAAYLDPDRLGRGSLMAMADLGPDADAEKRFRAMAYLLDPDRDRRVFATPTVRSPVVPPRDGQRTLAQGLRALWSGRKAAAVKFAEREDFQESLAPFTALLSWEEFRDAARSRGDALPAVTRRKAVVLSLVISGHRPLRESRSAEDSEAEDWSLADWQSSHSLSSLSLQTITPFDPQNCHYRDGKWVPAD